MMISESLWLAPYISGKKTSVQRFIFPYYQESPIWNRASSIPFDINPLQEQEKSDSLPTFGAVLQWILKIGQFSW